MIKTLSILGFRGFGEKQEIEFAIPDGETKGSGLTTIIGANNSGKTTIIEAIRAFNFIYDETPSFSEGRRNIATGGKVTLELQDESGKQYTITSSSAGGSSTVKNEPFSLKFYVLQSRRFINFEFGKVDWSRDSYIRSAHRLENQRSAYLENFESRIFQIIKTKPQFDVLLTKVLGNDFQWTVEQRDSGSYYIKCTRDSITHSNEGIGDGVWSIFTICASLFDSEENSTIVIDEPELSVHPALQKRLMHLFLEYSQNRQIILCTHSAHFVNWEAIIGGAKLVRVSKEGVNSLCNALTTETSTLFSGMLRDLNNPHALGNDATEALFLDDNIILVEGQEDVVIYNKLSKELNIQIKGDFYGWGVGGASKMRAFLKLFKSLGYKHVVAIFDGDKATEAAAAEAEFSDYKIIVLRTNDIRDKEARTSSEKAGITRENGELKEEHKEYAIGLFTEINASLC